MKIDIEQTNHQGIPDENGDWYKWNEICDKCGIITKRPFLCSCKPNTKDKDYCLKCLRELLAADDEKTIY